MEFPVLSKPWRDLEKYREARLREARVEIDLALEFLEDGLIRNAAGKAVQAWKAYLASRLAEKREALKELFPGSRRIRAGEEEIEVEDVDVVIALVPTTQMIKLSTVVGEDAVEFTSLALDLHRYQYNGPDPEGFFSDVPDDRTAALIICRMAFRLAGDTDLFKRVCGVFKR